MKYQCTKCKAQFAFEEIRYGNDGKIYCKPCVGSKPKDTDNARATSIARSPLKAPSAKAPSEPKTVKYVCMDCNYRFSSSRPASICPNCGRKRIGQDVKVEQFLDDPDDECLNKNWLGLF